MTNVANDVARMAEFYQEMADIHAHYAERIRKTEEKYGVASPRKDVIRLGRGELPSLVRSLLSNPEFKESGMRLKHLTDVLWEKGYRTNRGPSQGRKAYNNLYQVVYQVCAKMIDNNEAVNDEHKYQLNEDGLRKAEAAEVDVDEAA